MTKLIDNSISQRNGPKEALILLEYYPGGHLLERLTKRNGSFLPSESIYKIFGQILIGVKSFHESCPPIIHRDLKLENILFAPVRLFFNCFII